MASLRARSIFVQTAYLLNTWAKGIDEHGLGTPPEDAERPEALPGETREGLGGAGRDPQGLGTPPEDAERPEAPRNGHPQT